MSFLRVDEQKKFPMIYAGDFNAKNPDGFLHLCRARKPSVLRGADISLCFSGTGINPMSILRVDEQKKFPMIFAGDFNAKDPDGFLHLCRARLIISCRY